MAFWILCHIINHHEDVLVPALGCRYKGTNNIDDHLCELRFLHSLYDVKRNSLDASPINVLLTLGMCACVLMGIFSQAWPIEVLMHPLLCTLATLMPRHDGIMSNRKYKGPKRYWHEQTSQRPVASLLPVGEPICYTVLQKLSDCLSGVCCGGVFSC